MDTRVDDGGPVFGPEEIRRLHLISRVPLGATAVELNITALEATESTQLMVWPAGQARPYATMLTVGPNEVRSNTVIVELGELYAVDMMNQAGSVNVVVDAIGWFTGDFAGMRPMRMVDSRFGYGAPAVQAGTDLEVVIGGRFDVPADARAVAMNVTALNASEPTSIMMWPKGTDTPPVATVVVPTSGVHGHSAIVGLAEGRMMMTASAGRVDVIVDVTGWFRADGRFVSVPVRRIVDTKIGACGAVLGPGETRTFPVTDAPDVSGVAVSIAAFEASEHTFVSVWPAGRPQPAVSSLNVMPNTGHVGAVVITELGTGGQISLFNATGTVHVTLDVIGTFSGSTPAGERTPCATPPPPPAPPAPARAPSSAAPGATPAPAAPATTAPPPTQASVSWQTSMLQAINRERSTAGLSPVSTCGALSRTAQSYADVLIGTRNISHTGPDGSTLQTRVAAGGYVGWTNIGENLAAGQATVDDVMVAWMNSPGHRANILKPAFTHVGFGRAKGIYQNNTVESWFWVQNFGASGVC